MFAANPLSLSVPEPAFESWLRDTGYLEIVDERANAADERPTDIPPSPSTSAAKSSSFPQTPTAESPIRQRQGGGSGFDSLPIHLRRLGSSIFSSSRTALSLLTLNPFAKLTADDFTGETPRWTVGFISAPAAQPSYSWPAGPVHVRMRVQENVKRYARNYAFLTILVLASSLYQMPESLLGCMACVILWEGFWFCTRRWDLERNHPALKNVFLYFIQMATAFVLYYCNLHVAMIVSLGISYAVMITHAFLRKLSPSSQSVVANRYKRHQHKKISKVELSSQ